MKYSCPEIVKYIVLLKCLLLFLLLLLLLYSIYQISIHLTLILAYPAQIIFHTRFEKAARTVE